MRVICVEDEKLILDQTVSMCRQINGIEYVKGFTRVRDALACLREDEIDLAFLDIGIPDMNGIELAAQIREHWPDTAVVFLTAHSQYALDAFRVRASGYLLKPVTKEMLEEEVAFIRSRRPDRRGRKSILVRTFGNFDIFVNGEIVQFKLAKSKELLAYLVDKQGSSVTRAEISAVLWEDRIYDRKLQKQLDVYVRSMRDTLKEYGIEEIFELKRGSLRICADQFECDAYLFFKGDSDAINSYRGEYMSNYSWASMTESVMYWSRWKD